MNFDNCKKYDLHCHTNYSLCSCADTASVLRRALRSSLSGLAITDHNEIAGALKAKKILSGDFKDESRKKDFELIIGEEIMTERGEVLAYYLNERIRPGPLFEVLDRIKEQGALSSIAHPYTIFRNGFRGDIFDVKKRADALECFNSRNLIPGRNMVAGKMAELLSLAKTGGSDAHLAFEVGCAYTLFPENMSLEKALKARKTFARGTTFFSLPGLIASAVSKRIR
jgi:predicted metal-dependent phosphoesterase TrpH